MFLANMSHEICAPLHAVLGYVQILQQDRSLRTDQRPSAATIKRSGEAASKGSLKNLVTKQAKKLTQREKHTKVAKAAKRFRDSPIFASLAIFCSSPKPKNLPSRIPRMKKALETLLIRLHPRHPVSSSEPSLWPNPIPVRGEEVKVRQVPINLLSTAVKFTDAGHA